MFNEHVYEVTQELENTITEHGYSELTYCVSPKYRGVSVDTLMFHLIDYVNAYHKHKILLSL